MIGNICNIQPFSVHDGPGIRTTVFMKGCSLRCFWCHNPESQDTKKTIAYYSHKCIGCGACGAVCPHSENGKAAFFSERCILCGKCAEACFAEAIEAIGEEISADQLMEKLLRDKSMFCSSGGGVTFSGGEPLLQADFVSEVLKRCKAEGIHTAVETAAHVPWESFEKVIPYCDCFICDIKSADTEKHRRATGAGNERILENLTKLTAIHKNVEIRTPVIPGFNDSEEDIIAIRDIVRSFGGEVNYSLLPFRGMCRSKYISQGRIFEAANIDEPSKEKMDRLNALLKN